MIPVKRVALLIAALSCFWGFCAYPLGAADTVTFTVVGRVQFSVPSDWVVIASKSETTNTLFAFQIKNPADEGTPDSTNLAFVSYYLGDKNAKAAFKEKVSDQERHAKKKEDVQDWNCTSFTAKQGATQYQDWDCNRVLANCGVFIRLAWPELPKNPLNYDKDMLAALTDVLKSVAPSRK